MNTPNWFNKRDLPKTAAGDYFIDDVRLQTPGFRVGGPILKDKLFYFFNYEEFRLPESRQRTRYMLNTCGAARHLHVPGGGRQRQQDHQPADAGREQGPDLDPGSRRCRSCSARSGPHRLRRARWQYYDQNVDRYDYVNNGHAAAEVPDAAPRLQRDDGPPG